MKVYMHILVKGRVQGVCYRAFVKKHSVKLNIRGYAKNLLDGNVEVLAHGEPDAITQLIQYCQKGPLLAKVESVIANQHDEVDLADDFHIL